MAKGNSFEMLARDAVERIEEARAAGKQMTFLPDEPAPGDSERAKRGKGKVTSQLREYLAAKGLRLPEEVLLQMAGMASTEDAFVTAMAATERVLAWAEAGARQTATGVKDGALVTIDLDTSATMGQRLATFQFVFTAQLRAAEALLPYGLAKVTPDVAVQQAVQVVVVGGGSGPVQAGKGPDQARDVTPQARRIAPPPMPHEMQQNQQVSEAVLPASDVPRRTDEASR
jgi:hypothetical protein